MGKLIAVWGAPESGKTTFSVKLAEMLYNRFRERRSIIVVFTDNTAPTIPVVFPNHRSEDIFSVGTVLSKPDFFANDVVANLVMTKEYSNLGFLGYRNGENRYSFPEHTETKAKHFYDLLTEIADYVIVDCMSLPDASSLTKIALENAHQNIRLYTPDLKCLSFQMSQNKIFAAAGYIKNEDISVMNIPRQELGFSAKIYLGKIAFTLPFSLALTEQYMEGNLALSLKDKRYTQVMSKIIERLV